jgi:hypothetical protein
MWLTIAGITLLAAIGLVFSLSRYNGLNSLERLTAEAKTAGCLPHNTKTRDPLFLRHLA